MSFTYEYIFRNEDDNYDLDEPTPSISEEMDQYMLKEKCHEEGLLERALEEERNEGRPSKRARFLSGLAARFLDENKLLVSENGQCFCYQEQVGCFRPVPDLQSYVADELGEDICVSLLNRDLREIAERLSMLKRLRVSIDGFNQPSVFVNLENGVYDVFFGEMKRHSPRYRFTYWVHAKFVPEPEKLACPVFEEFCRSSLEGDPEKRQLLLEFIGYILMDSNAGKCALFLKGQPDTGKSVISEFITRLFDDELISSIPLHELSSRFFKAELAMKKLNVAGEIAGRALHDISVFKSVTGSDRITGEFKGQKPFSFVPRCKLLFSGNTLPLTREADATAAFVNRIRVLLFNKSIPKVEQDKGLLDKLWEERDTIVTLALQAAEKLLARGYEFTVPQDSKEFLASFKHRGNILGLFLEECCELSPEGKVFNTELYAAFTSFCEHNGLECMRRTRFYEMLSGIPHVTAKRLRIGSENRQGHQGISLKKVSRHGTLEQTRETSCGARNLDVPANGTTV